MVTSVVLLPHLQAALLESPFPQPWPNVHTWLEKWFREITVLAEDQSSIPSSHVRRLNISSYSKALMLVSDHHRYLLYSHTHNL